MNLQEVFDQLSVGEFSQLSIGGADAGVIGEANYDKILPHINLALTVLYRRFALKKGLVYVNLTEGVTLYTLSSKFDVNNARSKEAVKYLTAETGRFGDDVLKIEQVSTEAGHPLALNTKAPYAIATPSAVVIRVPADLLEQPSDLPEELKTDRLVVHYRAAHPTITNSLGFFDPASVQLQLPATHLDALLYFVAARYTTPVGMSTQDQTSNTYLAKYEAACQELEGKGNYIEDDTVSNRFSERGFI